MKLGIQNLFDFQDSRYIFCHFDRSGEIWLRTRDKTNQRPDLSIALRSTRDDKIINVAIPVSLVRGYYGRKIEKCKRIFHIAYIVLGFSLGKDTPTVKVGRGVQFL